MSRMVRNTEINGLKERLYFARLLAGQIEQGMGENASTALLLAYRGGLIAHLYSILSGVLRQAGQNYKLALPVDELSLLALTRHFSQSGVQAAEAILIDNAINDPADSLHWLHQQMMTVFSAAGMARRPRPPTEDNELTLNADDPDRLLSETDLARLNHSIAKVSTLIDELAAYGEEW